MSRQSVGAAELLVIDDDPSSAYLVERYLREEGFGVTHALSGPSGLAALRGRPYDLALVDLFLPGFDGLELCRRLRADDGLRRLPVVVFTGHDVTDLERQVFEAGATDILRKPVQREGLLARVRSLLMLSGAARERELLVQLSQAEKLAAIGQIAAGVAHEINNPLAFMLSNIEEAARVFGELEEVLAAYRRAPAEGRAAEERLGLSASLGDMAALFQETRAGGDRVRAIVRQLKVFSRMNGAATEPVDLAEVARGTLLLTGRELALHAQVEAQLEPAPISAALAADLHQVVLNLVINAMQAMEGSTPGTGRLRIRTGCEGTDAVLRLCDNGPGIPPEVQPRIFEPFFTTKPVGVGTGLGLSFSAEVARKLGGTLSFESSPGRTEFVLKVPTGEPASAEDAGPRRLGP